MRLAINLRTYMKGRIGGMENYVRRVMAGIAEHQSRLDGEWTVFAHESEVDNVREMCSGALIVPVIHETAVSVIETELHRTRYDLLFCPLLVLDPMKPGIPAAVTIPDLQHEFYPEFFDSNTLRWRRETFCPSVFHSDVVFTISEFSKRTIIEKFRADPDKIVVVTLDADDEFRRPTTTAAQAAFRDLELFDEYVYYPANYWPHKNHANLLRAMKLIHEAGHPNLGLVLTGASDGVERVRKEISTLGLNEKVRILSYQPQPVIAEIYRHARALVFVSQFEGFGIPLLEAFHTGTPVVSSRAGSLPEVGGDAALFVDELCPDDIAAGVRRILEEEPFRNDLIQKGRQRALVYKWDRAIELTLDWFDRVTNPSRARRVQVNEYPLVSIVTPSFNMARFLEETIQSVLTQDYPKIEYVVMDAGSNDGTLDLLRKYEGRLRYRSERDGGQANAVNRGFAESTGEIFAFLNADDTYLPGAVAAAVRSLLPNRSAGAVYGEAYHVREDGTIIDRYPTQPFDYERLNRDCFICQPATFMNRSAFAALGGMNETLHYALDYDLWIRMARLYPLMKIDDYLATSRVHAANKTLGSRRKVYEEIIAVAKAHYGYVPFEWVYGYASYLLDHKNPFFDQLSATPAKLALGLLLGSYHNRSQLRRYGKEWATQIGIDPGFRGRWSDGWISKCYVSEIRVPDDCMSIRLEGKNFAPLRGGMTLTIKLNGSVIQRTSLRDHGPFAFQAKCPIEARGKNTVLQIESNRTFRPITGGDLRKLSCIVDNITFQ